MIQYLELARGLRLWLFFYFIYSTRSSFWSCRGSNNFYRKNLAERVGK